MANLEALDEISNSISKLRWVKVFWKSQLIFHYASTNTVILKGDQMSSICIKSQGNETIWIWKILEDVYFVVTVDSAVEKSKYETHISEALENIKKGECNYR